MSITHFGNLLQNRLSVPVAVYCDHIYELNSYGDPSIFNTLVSTASDSEELRAALSARLSDRCLGEYTAKNCCTLSDFTFTKPFRPLEIWAVGVTYKRQASEHEADVRTRNLPQSGIYEYVYSSQRPEVFFKGFDRTSVGHSDSVAIRSDSQQTLPEAELVLLLGKNGVVLGYTIGNDLTAWDIELECPLFLSQAKIWDGCSSFGPLIALPSKLLDPSDLHLTCKVFRENTCVINSTGRTSGMSRTFSELVQCLTSNNSVPAGSLLFTGTCCVIPHDFRLQDGDIIEIFSPGIGKLTNTVGAHLGSCSTIHI